MIEKQRKQQAEALEKHKKKVQEEEAKKAQEAEALDNDREARIDLNALNKDEELDIDDIWCSFCNMKFTHIVENRNKFSENTISIID